MHREIDFNELVVIINRSSGEDTVRNRLAVKHDYATGFSSGAEAMGSGPDETGKITN